MAAAANVDQNLYRKKENRRGFSYTIFEGHLKLSALKTYAKNLGNRYLSKENIPPHPHMPQYFHIPRYPQPEFCISLLKHDTDQAGLQGIREDKGFKNLLNDSLAWWSLNVGHNEITSAAETPMMTNPEGELVEMRPDDLKKFATSPAFKESSRYGTYRFILPLEKVLQAYSQQFCDGKQPIMRAFETHLYTQEVMYVVLVHRPCDEELYMNYPVLTDTPDPVCAYRNGCIIWRAQAMCDTHKFKLEKKSSEQLMEAVEMNSPEFYMWDNVSVALHMGNQVLKINDNDLCNSLKFCSKGYPFIGKTFNEPEERDKLVKELWPNCPALQETAKVEETA